jgi:hypothetical protein
MEFDFNTGGTEMFNMDDTDFSNFEVDFEVEFDTRYIKPPKSKEITDQQTKYANAEKLAKDVSIGINERIFVIVNGSFIFGDFIEALIIEKKYKVKSMTISTLSMSEENVCSLEGLLNGGYIDELNLLVSNYFYSHERWNLIPYIYQELDKNNKFQFAVCSTHCKICIFETYCGKFIVLHGSCNLRSSSNIEQFVIEESKELYDFNYEYQMKIIEKFKTINKDNTKRNVKFVRDNTLWKTIN